RRPLPLAHCRLSHRLAWLSRHRRPRHRLRVDSATETVAQSTQTRTHRSPLPTPVTNRRIPQAHGSAWRLCVDSATETVAQSTRTRTWRGLCRSSDRNPWLSRQCAATGGSARQRAATGGNGGLGRVDGTASLRDDAHGDAVDGVVLVTAAVPHRLERLRDAIGVGGAATQLVLARAC